MAEYVIATTRAAEGQSASGKTPVSDANPMPVSPGAAASGGATPFQLISAGSNNATSLKGTPGQVYTISVFNFNTASARYLKFYDKASAPNPASDTPLKTIPIPMATSATQPGGVVISGPACGIGFLSGIALAIVANLASNDNTAVSANDVVVNIDYK